MKIRIFGSFKHIFNPKYIMAETNPNHLHDIMQYESQIWAAADLLIAAGVKQSKFPDFMMPFFALVMLEGRMRNVIAQLEEDGLSRDVDLDEFIEAFRDEKCGYNEFIVREGKTLSMICSNSTVLRFRKIMLCSAESSSVCTVAATNY